MGYLEPKRGRGRRRRARAYPILRDLPLVAGALCLLRVAPVW